MTLTDFYLGGFTHPTTDQHEETGMDEYSEGYEEGWQIAGEPDKTKRAEVQRQARTRSVEYRDGFRDGFSEASRGIA